MFSTISNLHSSHSPARKPVSRHPDILCWNAFLHTYQKPKKLNAEENADCLTTLLRMEIPIPPWPDPGSPMPPWSTVPAGIRSLGNGKWQHIANPSPGHPSPQALCALAERAPGPGPSAIFRATMPSRASCWSTWRRQNISTVDLILDATLPLQGITGDLRLVRVACTWNTAHSWIFAFSWPPSPVPVPHVYQDAQHWWSGSRYTPTACVPLPTCSAWTRQQPCCGWPLPYLKGLSKVEEVWLSRRTQSLFLSDHSVNLCRCAN